LNFSVIVCYIGPENKKLGVCIKMNELTQSELTKVSAGIASLSADGILVTGQSKMSLNGLGFSAQGYIYNSFSNNIYFDFTQDGNSYCLQGNLYTAIAVDGGYLYQTSSC
tara:strand:+ start:10092 stop:10421 length:330 start_codon:yes stop_codon:yes gene_type:complete